MRAELAAARRRTSGIALAVPCALLLQALACSGEDVVLGSGRSDADGAAVPPPEADAASVEASFSEPRAIAEIAQVDATDDDPSLSSDLTLLYFNSEREQGTGQEDIWSSERAAPDVPWQSPVPVAELNTAERETGIALAPDGLAIWWSSDREGGDGGLDVYTAARDSRTAPWSAPARVVELSSAGDDLVSAVGDDERTVLLARRADEDDDYDLFIASRADRAATWSEPVPVPELNSAEEESDGFLLEDGLSLLFTRDEDLQLARRDRRAAPFAAPIALDALNSDDDDRDAWAGQDFGYVVFSSDRSGSYLLYEATR